jgi:hypothetical protein
MEHRAKCRSEVEIFGYDEEECVRSLFGVPEMMLRASSAGGNRNRRNGSCAILDLSSTPRKGGKRADYFRILPRCKWGLRCWYVAQSSHVADVSGQSIGHIFKTVRKCWYLTTSQCCAISQRSENLRAVDSAVLVILHSCPHAKGTQWRSRLRHCAKGTQWRSRLRHCAKGTQWRSRLRHCAASRKVPVGSLEFSLTWSYRPHYGPVVDSTCNRN